MNWKKKVTGSEDYQVVRIEGTVNYKIFIKQHDVLVTKRKLYYHFTGAGVHLSLLFILLSKQGGSVHGRVFCQV